MPSTRHTTQPERLLKLADHVRTLDWVGPDRGIDIRRAPLGATWYRSVGELRRHPLTHWHAGWSFSLVTITDTDTDGGSVPGVIGCSEVHAVSLLAPILAPDLPPERSVEAAAVALLGLDLDTARDLFTPVWDFGPPNATGRRVQWTRDRVTPDMAADVLERVAHGESPNSAWEPVGALIRQRTKIDWRALDRERERGGR